MLSVLPSERNGTGLFPPSSSFSFFPIHWIESFIHSVSHWFMAFIRADLRAKRYDTTHHLLWQSSSWFLLVTQRNRGEGSHEADVRWSESSEVKEPTRRKWEERAKEGHHHHHHQRPFGHQNRSSSILTGMSHVMITRAKREDQEENESSRGWITFDHDDCDHQRMMTWLLDFWDREKKTKTRRNSCITRSWMKGWKTEQTVSSSRRMKMTSWSWYYGIIQLLLFMWYKRRISFFFSIYRKQSWKPFRNRKRGLDVQRGYYGATREILPLRNLCQAYGKKRRRVSEDWLNYGWVLDEWIAGCQS